MRKLSASLLCNAVFLIVNSMTGSILGFIFWTIATRMFNPSDIGVGSSLLSSASFIALFSGLGLGPAIIKMVTDYKDKSTCSINSVITLVTTSTTISFIIVMLLWPKVLINSPGWLYWTVCVGQSVLLVLDHVFLAISAGHMVFLKNTLVAILKFPFVFLILKGYGALGIFAGNGLAVLFVVIFTILVLIKRVMPKYSFKIDLNYKIIGKRLCFSFANHLVQLANAIPSMLFPIFVLHFIGSEEAAYFYISWMIANVVVMVAQGFSTSLFIEGSKRPQDLNYNTRKVFLIVLAILVPTVIFIEYTAPYILMLFGNIYSIKGTYTLRILLAGILPYFLCILNIAANQALGNTNGIAIQSSLTLLIMILLGISLSIKYGLIGAAYAITFTYLIIAITFGLKVFKKNHPENKNGC